MGCKNPREKSPLSCPVKGEDGEGIRGWKIFWSESFLKTTENIINSGCRLLFRRSAEPLANLSSYFFFPATPSIFITASQSRGADHGVGSNSTPTSWRSFNPCIVRVKTHTFSNVTIKWDTTTNVVIMTYNVWWAWKFNKVIPLKILLHVWFKTQTLLVKNTSLLTNQDIKVFLS